MKGELVASVAITATSVQHASQSQRWALEREANAAIAVMIMNSAYWPSDLTTALGWRPVGDRWRYLIAVRLPTARPSSYRSRAGWG